MVIFCAKHSQPQYVVVVSIDKYHMLWYTKAKQEYRAAVCLTVTLAHAERAVRVYCVSISAFGYIHLLTYSVFHSFPVHTPFGGFTAVLRRMTIPVNSAKRPTILTPGGSTAAPFAYGGLYMRQKMIT